MLHAPTLLLSGDRRRTRLEGALTIVDTPDAANAELPAMTLRAEMQPGKQGFSDFSAALQLDMQLDHLVVLAALFRPDRMPFLEQVGGQVQLWGRWQEGALADARLALDVPELTLRQDVEYAVLRNIQASGQWLRDGDGGGGMAQRQCRDRRVGTTRGGQRWPGTTTSLVSIASTRTVGIAHQRIRARLFGGVA